MRIRRANIEDVPFLTEAIIQAEKSGTDIFSYSRIFGISELGFRELLPELISEDVDGQELCVSGFLIAEVDESPAAAVCAWVEEESGLSSSQLKASLLMQYLDLEMMQKAASLSPLLEKVQIPRMPGSLQLESVYTAPAYRGKGLAAALIQEHIKQSRATKAEIIVAAENYAAIRAYEKAGFNKSLERFSDDPELRNYLPYLGKIQLQKQL